MWKIIFLITLILAAKSDAAELTCLDISCSQFHIINVTSPNEKIILPTLSTIPENLNFDITSNFDYFPTGILSVWDKTKQISIYNNGLRYLITDAFNYCDSLIYLAISNCDFSTIPAGSARNCKNLITFAFSGKSITNVDPNAFDGLTALIIVEISNSSITCVPPNIFTSNPNLGMISLDNNKISSLHADTIKGLSNIRGLDLSSNLLTYIPNINMAGTSTNVSNTMYFNLDLMNNPLRAIHPNFISSFFNYTIGSNRTLNLADKYPQNNVSYSSAPDTCFYQPSSYSTNFYQSDWNDSSRLPALENCYANWTKELDTQFKCYESVTLTTLASTTAAPGSCPSNKICRFYLDYLDRYTCVLDGVDGSLTSITGTHLSSLYNNLNVTRIYFKNSFLYKISSVVFTTFPNLDFLSVANCSLGMITNATITECGILSYLDARFNEIFHISDTAFKNCKNLQIIDLTGNPIEVLNINIFKSDPSLKKVILNNPDN